MRLLNLKNHFTAFHAPQTRRSAEDTQTYRLTVIVRSSALNKLVGLFVTELVPAGIMPGQNRHEKNERIHRFKIVAIAACTPPLRAALVRFVIRSSRGNASERACRDMGKRATGRNNRVALIQLFKDQQRSVCTGIS